MRPWLRSLALVGFFLISTPGIVLATVGPWTEYADHFSRSGFRALHLGDDKDRVRTLIGEPLQRETQDFWVSPMASPSDKLDPAVEKGRFAMMLRRNEPEPKAAGNKRTEEVWYYSRPLNWRKTFFFYAVTFNEQGRVERLTDQLIFD